MTLINDRSQTLEELIAWQDGVLDSGSALAYMTPDALRWRLKSGRWQQPCRGVIVAQSGPLNSMQTLRVAVLWAGTGSALGGLTAAKLYGFRGFGDKDDQIYVVRPAGRARRKTNPPLPVVVHYSSRLTAADIHPVRQPPQTRIARSLVDAADALQYWDDMDRDNDLTLERYQVMRFPAWVVRYQPEHVAAKIRQPLRNAGYRC